MVCSVSCILLFGFVGFVGRAQHVGMTFILSICMLRFCHDSQWWLFAKLCLRLIHDTHALLDLVHITFCSHA